MYDKRWRVKRGKKEDREKNVGIGSHGGLVDECLCVSRSCKV